MARTALTPQVISLAGIGPTYAAANVDGHSIVIRPAHFVHVKNGSASPITVTIPTPGTVDGLDIADRTITIAAGAERVFSLSKVLRQTDGTAYLNFSAVTTVTVAAFEV